MTAKIIKDAAIALILAGISSSCSDKAKNDIDPEKAILGKWELVVTYISQDHPIPRQPSGFYEFRPNGIVVWYDYASKEYTLPAMKYWFEPIELHPDHQLIDNDKRWHLHLRTEADCIFIGSYPDQGFSFLSLCTFFSKNQIGLVQLVDNTLVQWTYVYNRKWTYVYNRKK